MAISRFRFWSDSNQSHFEAGCREDGVQYSKPDPYTIEIENCPEYLQDTAREFGATEHEYGSRTEKRRRRS